MQPIKKLETLDYLKIQSKVVELLEQLQNHHIARAMDGAKDMEDYEMTRAAELVFRAMKVGITNGTGDPTNIVYMIDKLKQALEYLAYTYQL